ncbi:MAG TPA: LPS assembly lipoprotein LptE [Steroidobacteraceae bacterium]|nr:LPS assembly lipoprotein LptE [Steroidobacteraceae bacterium]
MSNGIRGVESRGNVARSAELRRLRPPLRAARTRAATAGACALAVVAAVLLSGCGFRLQGRMPLPPPLAVTYVIAPNDQSDFVQGLRKALITNGGKLAEDSTSATGTVRILTDDVTSKILSVSANNIPREYELTYTVEFSVSSKDAELLPAQKVSVTRDYSFDERTLLAKENEAAILREGMARDLVNIVMRRLASL